MDALKAEAAAAAAAAAAKIGPPVPKKIRERVLQRRRRHAQVNPAPLPTIGKAQGMLATFEKSMRKKLAPKATIGPDGEREHDWVRAFYRSWRVGDSVYVPLTGEPHNAVKAHVNDWRRLQDDELMQGTRWIRDEKTGAIRCFKHSRSGDRSGSTYDVVAIIHDLHKGDSYTLTDPLDLTSVQVHRC